MSAHTQVAGLTPAHAAEMRRTILRGVNLLVAHRSEVHYTQGALRWEGINRNLRIARGEFPHHGDCSSTHTWLYWNGLTHVGGHVDHLNHQHFQGGYTGTIASHGILIPSIRMAKIGDAILYGPRPTFEHVATYIGGGLVFSHGSEPGPYILKYDYRPVGMIRRHI